MYAQSRNRFALRAVRDLLRQLIVAILAVSGTDYLVTVPRRLAKIVAPLQKVRAIEAPVELPKFNYMMAWHPRLTNEPAQQWLREQVRAVASKV